MTTATERWALFDPQGELLLVPSYCIDTANDVWWEWICWNGNGELSHLEDWSRWQVEPVIARLKSEGYRVERVTIIRGVIKLGAEAAVGEFVKAGDRPTDAVSQNETVSG